MASTALIVRGDSPPSARWRSLAVAFLTVVLFFIANRGAYKGYFYGDDLDILSWVTAGSAADFLPYLVTPRFSPTNFRPVGHFFFHVFGKTAGIDGFPMFVAGLQALHLVNGMLLWWVLRRLGFRHLSCLPAVVFFLFNEATFVAYWEPRYVFDVLCATFCLLSIAAWIERRWVLSFVAFWLAYKAKEVAIGLPAVLLAYECILSPRRSWKPLVPFFAVAFSFVLQGMYVNAHNVTVGHTYRLRVTPTAVWTSAMYYCDQLRLLPWGAVLIGVALVLIHDRRFVFGLVAATMLVGPMLVFPNHLYSVYLYCAMAGLAVALAACVEMKPHLIAALFLVIWLPFTYGRMRSFRSIELADAQERRSYVQQLRAIVRDDVTSRAYIFDGYPRSFDWWGVTAAIRIFSKHPDVHIASAETSEADKLRSSPSASLLSWDHVGQLTLARADTPLFSPSYLNIGPTTRSWNLGEGWIRRDDAWISDAAIARLLRPSGARVFEALVKVNPATLIERTPPRLEVLVDRDPIGEVVLTEPGWQKLSWAVPLRERKQVTMEFRVHPRPDTGEHLNRIAISNFGFLP